MAKMRGQKTFRHKLKTAGVAVVVLIYHDWDDELVALDAASALARQRPFLAKKSLLACFGVRRDQRQKQIATVDGVADLLFPVVARLQFTFVEPGYISADTLQASEELTGCSQISARIA